MSFKLATVISIFICILNYASAEQNEKSTKPIKDEMSKVVMSEMGTVFHRKPDIKNIPKHGVVPFVTTAKLEQNDNPLIKVDACSPQGSVYKLNLSPLKHNVFSTNTPLTVVYTVETSLNSTQNHTYRIADRGNRKVKINGTYYEDVQKSAILLVSTIDGNDYYDGTIAEGLKRNIVRPVPEKWKKWYMSTKHEHIVYKRSVDTCDGKPSVKIHKIKLKTKNQVDDARTLYPKLIIAVDYSLFELLGKNVPETIQYITTFWNAVNLKYREFKKPEIKILVTGIIIAKDKTAMNYVYNSQEKHDMSKVNASSILRLGRLYFYKRFTNETGFKNYDATIVMSALSAGKTLGLAYTGSICMEDYGMAFVHDTGNFIGVPIAAHELGHLLTVRHDDKNCTAIPVNVNDTSNVHTIMNPHYRTAEEFVWSDCSKHVLSNLAKSRKADCLKVRRYV